MNENIEDENKETIKKKSNKGIIIFLIIFTIISIGITIGGIYYTNKLKKENKTEDEEEVIKVQRVIPDNLGIKTLKDKYDLNDLEITEKTITRGKEMIETYNNGETTSYYPVIIRYKQISGLKDKNIENKINKEIEELAISMIPLKWEEGKNTYNYRISCVANFSNVLSVVCQDNDDNKINKYNNYGSTFKSLNYDLTTGEKIQLKDIFTNTANIRSIISQSSYNSLVLEHAAYKMDADFSNIDYSQVEDEIFKIISTYNNDNNVKFYFTIKEIIIDINDIIITIPMYDYYKDIAIFNRYANKDIFDGTYENYKDIFVFVNRDKEYCYYSILDEFNDNLYVDIVIHNNFDNINKVKDINKVLELYKKEINEKVESLKKYSKNNPNKGIVCSLFVSIYPYNNTGNIESDNEIRYYETEKEYYKSILLNEILSCVQKPRGGGGASGSNYYISNEITKNLDKYINEYIYRKYDSSTNIYFESKYNEGKENITKYDMITGKVIEDENKIEM